MNEKIRTQYPKGTRVELVSMDDPQAPPVGTRGTVTGVDDAGSILVDWDNGSGLNVIYGTNMFDVPMVQQIANREGYYELVIFLIDHAKEYAHFIMTGET